MPKKNIVIVGGGFAGLSALSYFGAHRKLWSRDFEVILIDPKPYSEFLPMLPDVVNGRIAPESLRFPLDAACRRNGCAFINERVNRVDVSGKRAYAGSQTADYEYILISAGSETDFHGRKELERHCFKLDSVSDAVLLRNEIISRASSGRPVNVVVIGAGYTGIEISSASAFLLENLSARYSVTIADTAPDVLTASPPWMRRDCRLELEREKTGVLSGASLKSVSGRTVVLSSGMEIDNALCIWAAGVRVPEFLDGVPAARFRTRLGVDGTLKLSGASAGCGVFAAGDAAAFYVKGSKTPLRMAVMFAMGQGTAAAANIMRSISGKVLIKCRTADLGYVIPFSSGRAPGMALGMRVNPWIGFLMHYFMCLYRAPFRSKINIARDIASRNKTGGRR